MANVVLKKVEKEYTNGFKAVHGMNLEIKDGEFMVFVGPSGCSKSTTLRMIAGLEEITHGEVWIGEKCVNTISPAHRKVAMVFQNYALYPHMNAYENMAFGLKMKNVDKQVIDEKVRGTAKKLEIEELLFRKPKEMSGGQRQRVALGRALVRTPEVFLFDEPLSNLDAKLRVSMRLRIQHLHQQLKAEGDPATMIYVTHDQVEAMTMGDRICVMNEGRIVQVDTPDKLYHMPKNKFVAQFIGGPPMNMVKGRVMETQEGIQIEISGGFLKLHREKGNKIKDYIGQELYLGIRPENIVCKEKEEGEFDAVMGEITVTEQLGNEELIHFNYGEDQFTARIHEDLGLHREVGKEYQFYFDLSKCHLFDPDTEKNLTL